jgi:hypothetical protein
MSKPTEVEIPTLTDIVKPGDADMTRHFDTRGFNYTKQPAGLSAEKVEELVTEVLEEMLPEFKQQLLARLQERLKA